MLMISDCLLMCELPFRNRMYAYRVFLHCVSDDQQSIAVSQMNPLAYVSSINMGM